MSLRRARALNPDANVVPTEWLAERISVEKAEASHPGIDDERVARFPSAGRPFGFQNGRWEDLKAGLRPGDELWTFASPLESWQYLTGRAGVALVRGGRVVDAIVTKMN